MNQPIIAAQLFTLRDLLKEKSESEIRDVLSQVKNIGYTAIQVSGVGQASEELVDIYSKIANELDLDICATHFNLDYMEENTQWIIDLHKKWKCNYAGIGSMPMECRHADGIVEFIERCNTLGQKLKKEGIQLIYHNHNFEFEKIGNKTWLQMLLDGFDPAYVQLEIDVYWVQAGGENPISWINKVKDQMGVMHYKDMRIIDGQQQFAEIGEGNLEWKDIIQASKEANVKYAAVEQDSFTDDPIQSLKVSYDFLKKHL